MPGLGLRMRIVSVLGRGIQPNILTSSVKDIRNADVGLQDLQSALGSFTTGI